MENRYAILDDGEDHKLVHDAVTAELAKAPCLKRIRAAIRTKRIRYVASLYEAHRLGYTNCRFCTSGCHAGTISNIILEKTDHITTRTEGIREGVDEFHAEFKKSQFDGFVNYIAALIFAIVPLGALFTDSTSRLTPGYVEILKCVLIILPAFGVVFTLLAIFDVLASMKSASYMNARIGTALARMIWRSAFKTTGNAGGTARNLSLLYALGAAGLVVDIPLHKDPKLLVVCIWYAFCAVVVRYVFCHWLIDIRETKFRYWMVDRLPRCD